LSIRVFKEKQRERLMKRFIILSAVILLCQPVYAAKDICRENIECQCKSTLGVDDSCGKPGQTFRCWENKCRLVFDSESEEMWCKRIGGTWGRFGLMEVDRCNVMTSDVGKICKDSSDCEGACIADLTEAEHKKLEAGESLVKDGKCSKFELNYDCLPFVKDGKVKDIVCVD
jgi:hypothetical protein